MEPSVQVLTFESYSCLTTFFPIAVIAVVACQALADRYGTVKIKDKVTRVLLYGVYLSALLCTLVGYSLHRSEHHPLWCRLYGIPPCFITYGGGKAFVLGFFLRRARKSHESTIDNDRCKHLIFDRLGPLYVLLYWVMYASLASLFFTGSPTTVSSSSSGEPRTEEEVVSWCRFGSWSLWFVVTANVVDFCNCVIALALFVHPLMCALRELRTHQDHPASVQAVTTMKWNVALSFVTTFTSFFTLYCLKPAGPYVWLFCTADPLVNSMCAFAMMTSNRTCVTQSCSRCYTYCWRGCHRRLSLATTAVPSTSTLRKRRASKSSSSSLSTNAVTSGNHEAEPPASPPDEIDVEFNLVSEAVRMDAAAGATPVSFAVGVSAVHVPVMEDHQAETTVCAVGVACAMSPITKMESDERSDGQDSDHTIHANIELSLPVCTNPVKKPDRIRSNSF